MQLQSELTIVSGIMTRYCHVILNICSESFKCQYIGVCWYCIATAIFGKSDSIWRRSTLRLLGIVKNFGKRNQDVWKVTTIVLMKWIDPNRHTAVSVFAQDHNSQLNMREDQMSALKIQSIATVLFTRLKKSQTPISPQRPAEFMNPKRLRKKSQFKLKWGGSLFMQGKNVRQTTER